MKKRIMIIAMLLACTIVLPLTVAEIRSEPDTVAAAMFMDDDVKITLKGFILEKLDEELYVISDDTGSMNVEIKNDLWKDHEMDPNVEVEIHGTIDRDEDSLRVEAKKLKFLE